MDWMTRIETIKRQIRATYGCTPKSVRAALGCGRGCTPALSVTHSAAAAAEYGLWHYTSAMSLPFKVVWSWTEHWVPM